MIKLGRSTVRDSYVVKHLVQTPDGPRMASLGVRINLENGEWWFCHRSGSWTHHYPDTIKQGWVPKTIPGRVLKYRNEEELRAKLGQCPSLVEGLLAIDAELLPRTNIVHWWSNERCETY